MRWILYYAFLLVLLFSTALHAEELHFFVVAGMRQPVDQLIDKYQKETGHRVLVDYDGSGRLLARIAASGLGDLYMPGSFFYIEKLQARGKIHSWKPVAAHTPVIAVNRSGAQNLSSFKDLAEPGTRLALGDPKAMAFGKIAMNILDSSGMKDPILANIIAYGVTVKQLVLYVAEGNVDASIVGRADAFQFMKQVRIVSIPEDYFESETIAVAVLKSSSNIEGAVNLQDFLISSEAIQVFENFGFLPLED